ncbi:MAG: hypothetical protein KZQ89_20345 [Candidatus Thiodiazotropha sp. (ex Lucinoma kastoroae)]|nr:hypothetical protein [Candidatus Thiodiazotropha sp. (ex Lucinoma kastoroae)]MCU7858265.1 hypothetical protein [Candidatus Thiodiazotropha sp. (ex Lucinoma kastoroae)]
MSIGVAGIFHLIDLYYIGYVGAMNPVRIIAMSAPNGVNFRSVGQSTSGANVNPSIAAAMCSGMPPLWWSAARLKWADDTYGITLLHDELLKFAEELKQRENWGMQKKGRGYLDKLVMLALLEMSQPNKYRKDKPKCEFLGMSASYFSSRWKKCYEMIYRQLEDWCSLAINHIYKNNNLN